MQVSFPFVLNDVRGENLDMLDLTSSMIKLPQTRLKIKASLEEQKVEGSGNDTKGSFDYDE